MIAMIGCLRLSAIMQHNLKNFSFAEVQCSVLYNIVIIFGVVNHMHASKITITQISKYQLVLTRTRVILYCKDFQ